MQFVTKTNDRPPGLGPAPAPLLSSPRAPWVSSSAGKRPSQMGLSRPAPLLSAGPGHPMASWASLRCVQGLLERNVSERKCPLLPSVHSLWGRKTSVGRSDHQPCVDLLLLPLCRPSPARSIMMTRPSNSVLSLLLGPLCPHRPGTRTRISSCGAAMALSGLRLHSSCGPV